MRGAWIEIMMQRIEQEWRHGRSPCGERGLKYQTFVNILLHHTESLPVRGAWIEISTAAVTLQPPLSLPVRGAWIEINRREHYDAEVPTSLPVRGAWIEILKMSITLSIVTVAPRAGSVD